MLFLWRMRPMIALLPPNKNFNIHIIPTRYDKYMTLLLLFIALRWLMLTELFQETICLGKIDLIYWSCIVATVFWTIELLSLWIWMTSVLEILILSKLTPYLIANSNIDLRITIWSIRKLLVWLSRAKLYNSSRKLNLLKIQNEAIYF